MDEANNEVVTELPLLSVVVIGTVVPPLLLETIEDVNPWSLDVVVALD